ncbi:MAG TPA: LacI family DNA-binding transcriptional regulator [Opitutaceae bacterium]|nr:LacI family DNA-binding transcriptional regulator [Opitutaceae bacterium]
MPKSARKNSARPTVISVAARAGVSIGSVSTVLNNRHLERRISPETVQRIRQVALEMGYLPHIGAKQMRSRGGAKNNLILALITSFEAPISLINHFILAFRRAITEGSFRRTDCALSIMIEMYAAGRLREMPGLLSGDHFNAGVIMNTIAEDDHFLNRSHLPFPSVLVNRVVPGYTSVIEPPNAGARSAEILIQGKRSRLVVLHSQSLTQSTRARVDSFMQRSGELLGRASREVVANQLSETGGYEAMLAVLKSGTPPDGLYATSDGLALGAYRAIKERGLKIPRDISVIGVGDYEISPFFDPPLSCVGVSHQELAEKASRLLLRQLEGGGHEPQTVVVPVVETLRASSAAR